MLTDNFGRKFYYLRLLTTGVYNFSCDYCLPNSYQCDDDRKFLTLPEITRLASAFSAMGTEKIRITGGEPSLRKDLPEIIAGCKRTLGIKKVAITSNGYKLPEHLPAWINAGIDAINISIDTLDPRQFHAITGHDKLKNTLKGTDVAVAADNIDVKVNTVLMREYNGYDIASYLARLKNTPITLRLVESSQETDNKEFFYHQHVKGSRIKQHLILDGWLPVINDKAAGPAQEFYHPDYAGKIGLSIPYSKDFCNTYNRLRISAIGKLHLCLFTAQDLSLKDYLKSDDVEPFKVAITRMLTDKKQTHFLHEKLTGATKNLAMLGC
jgi:cyclic pyranopterin phosphate synthase